MPLALAVAASGLVAGQSFAQGRDFTVTRDTPNGGVVTKHIVRSDDGVVHRVVRVHRPDGSVVVHRSTRVANRDFDGPRFHRSARIIDRGDGRTVVIRHRDDY